MVIFKVRPKYSASIKFLFGPQPNIASHTSNGINTNKCSVWVPIRRKWDLQFSPAGGLTFNNNEIKLYIFRFNPCHIHSPGSPGIEMKRTFLPRELLQRWTTSIGEYMSLNRWYATNDTLLQSRSLTTKRSSLTFASLASTESSWIYSNYLSRSPLNQYKTTRTAKSCRNFTDFVEIQIPHIRLMVSGERCKEKQYFSSPPLPISGKLWKSSAQMDTVILCPQI